VGPYGGVEAGGTKFICAVGTGPDDLGETVRIETTTPDETLARVIAYFESLPKIPETVGLATFGPVDLVKTSPAFGRILKTPKAGWSGADIAGTIQRALNVPVTIDTDVNAAALAEGRWGAARGLESFLYITVGTGIGGGGMLEGNPIHGLNHPEMGHVLIPHSRAHDPYRGSCPYHGDCLEGLASGTAIRARWGKPAEVLPPGHAAWDLEAHYLAAGLVNLTFVAAPGRVILGGGVMRQSHLFPLLRRHYRDLLRGYLQNETVQSDLDAYIVPPALGDRAGILGAIALASSIA
jgi:fructokinase